MKKPTTSTLMDAGGVHAIQIVKERNDLFGFIGKINASSYCKLTS
jgi:hypothetical protein